MKRLITTALITALLLAGCSQPQAPETTETESPAQEVTATEQPDHSDDEHDEETCDDPSHDHDHDHETPEFVMPEGIEVSGTYAFGRYEINLDEHWIEFETYADEHGEAWRLASEKEILLSISVTEAPNKVVDAKAIQEEVEQDGYLHLEKETTLELDNGMTLYGAYVDDHATNSLFLYYLTKVEDDVVALIFSKSTPYSKEEIEWVHSVLETLKVNQ